MNIRKYVSDLFIVDSSLQYIFQFCHNNIKKLVCRASSVTRHWIVDYKLSYVSVCTTQPHALCEPLANLINNTLFIIGFETHRGHIPNIGMACLLWQEVSRRLLDKLDKFDKFYLQSICRKKILLRHGGS